MHAYQAREWSDFAVAVSGASAALAGLSFVALSIDLEGILAGRGLTSCRLRARAAQHSTRDRGVAPRPRAGGTSARDRAGRRGVLAGAGLSGLSRPGRRSARQPVVWWAVSEVFPAVLLAGSTVWAGAGLLTTTGGALYWLPLAVLGAFVGALLHAWVLSVEILR